MIVFVIATIVISAIGVISFYTSAWFGCHSSNTDKLPPHYQKLMNRFEKKKEAEQLRQSTRTDSFSDETVN